MATTVLEDILTWDTVFIATRIKEDGDLKVLRCKDFPDPQKRDAFVAGVAKAMAQSAAAS